MFWGTNWQRERPKHSERSPQGRRDAVRCMRGQVASIPWSSMSCQRDSTSCTGTRTGSTALEERASTFVWTRDSAVRVVRGLLTDDFSRFMRRSFWHWGQICPRGPGAMNERPQRLQMTGQNEGIIRHLPERGWVPDRIEQGGTKGSILPPICFLPGCAFRLSCPFVNAVSAR